MSGAAAAGGDVLLFLHADSILPAGFPRLIADAMALQSACWGRFDVRFDEGGLLLRAIARLISLRSRLSRVATGDQAIFVRRDAFEAVGGIREPELFEDIDLCRRLKRHGRMAVPGLPVVTSSRRWRRNGIWSTTFLMWSLKLLYLAGVPASRLKDYYRDTR
jgi:GT2 family glycosyltransferase